MAVKAKYHGMRYWNKKGNWNLVKATLLFLAGSDVL